MLTGDTLPFRGLPAERDSPDLARVSPAAAWSPGAVGRIGT